MLEPHCLQCGSLDLLTDAQRFCGDDGAAVLLGEIACRHARTCKYMGSQPTIQQVLDEMVGRKWPPKVMA